MAELDSCMKSNREASINLRVVRFGRQLEVPFSAGSLDPHPKDLIETLDIIMYIHLSKSFLPYLTGPHLDFPE
jgi:hypothetical protein